MDYVFTESFPFLLNRVGARIRELFAQRLAERDVTVPMYRILATLTQEGPQTLGDLAELVTVEVSTLSRLIGTMVRRGLVERRRREDNARAVRIEVTAEGRALAIELMPVAQQFELVGTQSFTPEEVAWLKQALRQIYDDLDVLNGGQAEYGD